MALKIAKSKEMMVGVAELNTTMRQLGYREGVQAGFAYCSRGKTIEDVRPLVDLESQSKVLTCVQNFGKQKFQLVTDLQMNP